MTPRYTPITTPLPELYQTSKLGMNTLALTEDFKRYFGIYLGQDKGCASGHYLYAAMAHTLRDRLFERMKIPNIPTPNRAANKPITCPWSF